MYRYIQCQTHVYTVVVYRTHNLHNHITASNLIRNVSVKHEFTIYINLSNKENEQVRPRTGIIQQYIRVRQKQKHQHHLEHIKFTSYKYTVLLYNTYTIQVYPEKLPLYFCQQYEENNEKKKEKRKLQRVKDKMENIQMEEQKVTHFKNVVELSVLLLVYSRSFCYTLYANCIRVTRLNQCILSDVLSYKSYKHQPTYP